MAPLPSPILTGPNPSPAQLNALAQVFLDTQDKINTYAASPQGQLDPNLEKITALALNLGTAAADIAVNALNLQVAAGPDPVTVINNATGALQTAIDTRNEITKTLGWIQSITTFAIAISAGDINGIVTSGTALYNKLTG